MAATCKKHGGQPYVMVCYSCDKTYQLICCECIAKNHKGHKLVTFETAANNVLERLRKEKANISPNLKELHVELKNFATLQENERKISANTKQYIQRRRDLLKLAIDEAAEILTEEQETSEKKIMEVLLSGKQHAENQVRNILEFQSNLAVLENSTDQQHVIQSCKRISFTNIPQFSIPSVRRHTLRRKETLDRRLVREMFGEVLEEDIRGSYILFTFDGKEEDDTESVHTTDLFGESTDRYKEDIVSEDEESDGNVGSLRNHRQRNTSNLQNQENFHNRPSLTWSSKQTPGFSSSPYSRSGPVVSASQNESQVVADRKYGISCPTLSQEDTTVFTVPVDQTSELRASANHRLNFPTLDRRQSEEFTQIYV